MTKLGVRLTNPWRVQTDWERERETERERQTDMQRETERERARERERERERQTEGERQTDMQRERERETDRHAERERDLQNVPRILNHNLHASPKTRHTTTHQLQHQCWNFPWLFCAPQCTPGPPPPHQPPTSVWWTSPTQRRSLYFRKDPKRCSLGPQSSITETPVTNSTIPPAHSPLHAQTPPSGTGEDKHHTSSTTPTKDSLHTSKPAVTNFTSTCCPSNTRKKEETKSHPTPREAPPAESTEPCWSCTPTPASELSQIREMLQTLCNQLLNR